MFIVIEGIDGSGKSTVTGMVDRFLTENGHKTLITREPTEMATGKLIRTFLSESGEHSDLFYRHLALLFAGDRLGHIEHEIFPALKKDMVVICDRYMFSSLAYQSLHVEYEWVKEINRFAIMPDLLVFIDVSVDTALARIGKRGDAREIFEKKSFLESIKSNYHQIIKDYGSHIRHVVIDGEKEISEVRSDVEAVLKSLII